MLDDVLYWYRAKVISVYDGDSFRARVDLGMNVQQRNLMLRLRGIDAPEVRGDEREEGLITRDHLRRRIGGEEIIVRTYKDKSGKYGRYIVEAFRTEEEKKIGDYCSIEDMVNVAEELLAEGLAERKEY